MNRNKKFTAFLMCLIMMVTMFSGMAVFTAENTTETIVSETGWPSFRGNAENMATVTSETPRSMGESHLKWNTKVTTGWTVSTPIIVGEFMYIATNEGLQKIDLTNGSVVQTAVLAGEMDYTPHLAYGDNKVFVPLKFGVIQAFDIETLAPLWKSSKLGEKDQSMTPIYYNDGNIYTGTYSGSGTYYCLTTSDDEPTLVDETKASKWTYKSAENANGYYWAGAVASGSNLIFGSENGVLTSLNTLTGAVIDTFAADSNIRSTIAKDGNYLYFTTKNATIYKIEINADGTFKKDLATSAKISESATESTSTPVVYGGRIYVGGKTAKAGLVSVIDAYTLTNIYDVDIEGNVQSSPLLTCAYDGKTQRVYIYVTYNKTPGGMKVIEDFSGNKEAIVSDLYLPGDGLKNYCLSSVIADSKGVLYYKNDSANVFAIEKNLPGYSPVSISVVPANANVEVLDKEANVVTPISAGNYDLPEGKYTCTATLSGYIPQSKVFNITKEEADGKLQKTIPISLVRENSNPSTTDKLLVKFTLLGDNLHETPESHKGNETWINKLSLLLPADSTVFDVFNKALNEKSFTFVEKSYSYIGSITTPKSMGENTLSEFANGPKSGWMYTVNGEYPMNGMRDEKLKDGDKILFYFTDDYTQEPPSFKWNTSGGSGGSGGGGSSRPTATATATPKPTAKVDLNSAIEDTANIVKANVKNPQVGSIGGEWAIIGLARSGASVPNEYYQKYYENVEKTVKTCGGVLDEKKYTEYSRVALALTAIGKDPKNVAGFNLLKPLGDYDKTVWQGINGAIWALIALDSGEYDIPQNTEAKVQATREMYVKYILDNQLSNGGFSLTGKEPADVDVTGMALQALNKYKAQNDVKNAMEKAVSALKKMQTNSGGFESFGVENIEGVSQVIVGINAMNMTADNADFTKNNNTLLDNLMSFYVEKSGFKHAKNDDKINQMATEQALYAMASAKRTIDKKPSLYNMSDVIKSDNDSSENGFGLIGKNPAIRLNKVIKAGKTFDDIRGHKNQKAIELLAERGVINGDSDSEFLPDLTMSRAEFATIIDRALGLELGGDKMFNDVADDAWYNMYVKTAYKYGIINGVSDSEFNPEGMITRQEATTMVARAAKLCGMEISKSDDEIRNILAGFTDYLESDDWAKAGLAFCYGEKILDDSEMEIKPNTEILRSEVAQMVFNMLDKAKLINK